MSDTRRTVLAAPVIASLIAIAIFSGGFESGDTATENPPKPAPDF